MRMSFLVQCAIPGMTKSPSSYSYVPEFFNISQPSLHCFSSKSKINMILRMEFKYLIQFLTSMPISECSLFNFSHPDSPPIIWGSIIGFWEARACVYTVNDAFKGAVPMPQVPHTRMKINSVELGILYSLIKHWYSRYHDPPKAVYQITNS